LPNKSCKILCILLFSAEVVRKLKFPNNSIMYNVFDGDVVNVFHAMKCRKAYYALLRERRNSDD